MAAEYRVDEFGEGELTKLEDTLNKMAREKWDVFSFNVTPHGAGRWYTVVFKRALPGKAAVMKIG